MLDRPDSIYNVITSLVDKRLAEHIAYLDFSKAFNTISHSMLMDQNISPSE